MFPFLMYWQNWIESFGTAGLPGFVVWLRVFQSLPFEGNELPKHCHFGLSEEFQQMKNDTLIGSAELLYRK